MKRSKKMTLILVVAMVMTVAMVVVAYAEIIYPQAWNSATGRYTQVYEMSTSPNWRYTTQITQYGLQPDENYGYAVKKVFSGRSGLVQCTSNGLNAFPTYYQIYWGGSDVVALSYSTNFTGTGTSEISFPSSVNIDTPMCLGIRNDPRYNGSVINKGNWSPDTF